jgi:hypothetical protein
LKQPLERAVVLVYDELCSSQFHMRRWRSGQSQQTVNLSPFGLRRFKSYPTHIQKTGHAGFLLGNVESVTSVFLLKNLATPPQSPSLPPAFDSLAESPLTEAVQLSSFFGRVRPQKHTQAFRFIPASHEDGSLSPRKIKAPFRALDFAGDGGIEPPTTVLETVVMPLN